MRLSEKREAAVYRAIHDSVLNLRIALREHGLPHRHDAQIAQLETTIWRAICAALDLQESRS